MTKQQLIEALEAMKADDRYQWSDFYNAMDKAIKLVEQLD